MIPNTRYSYTPGRPILKHTHAGRVKLLYYVQFLDLDLDLDLDVYIAGTSQWL